MSGPPGPVWGQGFVRQPWWMRSLWWRWVGPVEAWWFRHTKCQARQPLSFGEAVCGLWRWHRGEHNLP